MCKYELQGRNQRGDLEFKPFINLTIAEENAVVNNKNNKIFQNYL